MLKQGDVQSTFCIIACVLVILQVANAQEKGQCMAYRLPGPGDTIFLSSENWERNPAIPCQQGRFQLLLIKVFARGHQSMLYEAQLQHCTAVAKTLLQGLSPGPETTSSINSSCQPTVDACKLPTALTEPGRRLALKVQLKRQNIPKLQGCDEPWMQGARASYLRTHTLLRGMSSDAHVPTSYLVGDVYAANVSTQAQLEAGVPALLHELMNGQSLWPVEGRLGPVDTHRVISQVLRTLVDLHKKGWVHQDLHVGQIVCSPVLAKGPKEAPVPDGSIGNCVVVDFDMMVFLGNATDMPTHLHGTGHRAPEYYTGRVASTSDVWSMGIAMLTLRANWPKAYVKGLQHSRGNSTQTLALMRSAQPYVRLLQSEWDFIARCMAFDWKERPTAAMLLTDDFIMNGPLQGPSNPGRQKPREAPEGARQISKFGKASDGRRGTRL